MKLGDKMETAKLLGILFILLGVIFIAFPLFSAATVSIMAGVCLITFGIAAILNGFSIWSIVTHTSFIEMLFGFLLVLIGIAFCTDLTALNFLVTYSFYLIAITLIVIGVLGLMQGSDELKWASILILILGIIFFLLGIFSVTDPLLIAILVGICLIVRGVIFFTAGLAVDAIEYDANL